MRWLPALALLLPWVAHAARDDAAARAQHVVRPAALWARPSLAGDVQTILPRGASVRLLAPARNAAGDWWYVDSVEGRGWLRELDFAPAPAARARRAEIALWPPVPRPGGAVCERAATTHRPRKTR
ncbi:MAG TPA: hypothetical protein VM369_01905 [Candidatus Binatia bacterium]|nr:hypothetical protein [Candidatus Binatia bacterium]